MDAPPRFLCREDQKSCVFALPVGQAWSERHGVNENDDSPDSILQKLGRQLEAIGLLCGNDLPRLQAEAKDVAELVHAVGAIVGAVHKALDARDDRWLRNLAHAVGGRTRDDYDVIRDFRRSDAADLLIRRVAWWLAGSAEFKRAQQQPYDPIAYEAVAVQLTGFLTARLEDEADAFHDIAVDVLPFRPDCGKQATAELGELFRGLSPDRPIESLARDVIKTVLRAFGMEGGKVDNVFDYLRKREEKLRIADSGTQ